jgi:hypothetical protein
MTARMERRRGGHALSLLPCLVKIKPKAPAKLWKRTIAVLIIVAISNA